MLGQELAEIVSGPLFFRYGLSGGEGVYRPEGPYLRDLLSVTLAFDDEGRCDAVTVVLPWKLATHPLLGGPVTALLVDLLLEAAAGHKAAARFVEQRSSWPCELSPLEVELGPCLLTRSPLGEGLLSFRFSRLARRGLLERLGWKK